MRQRRAPVGGHAPWGWALAGILLGSLAALTTFAPAHWLAEGLTNATGGRIVLDDPRGTVWTGSARLVLTGGSASQDRSALPGRLQWQLRPSWGGLRAHLSAACCTPTPLVLQARPRWNGARIALPGRLHWRLRPAGAGLGVALQADCCTRTPLQLTIAPRWGGATVAVADSQSQWPASVLTGLGTPWNTLQPQGRLALHTQALALQWAAGRLQMTGQAQLDMLAMSSRLSTLRPMGSYRLQLTGGATPTLTLQTLEGLLLLSGSGQWVGQRLRFTGEASAAPDHEAQLSNLLNIIGRRAGSRSVISLG